MRDEDVRHPGVQCQLVVVKISPCKLNEVIKTFISTCRSLALCLVWLFAELRHLNAQGSGRYSCRLKDMEM